MKENKNQIVEALTTKHIETIEAIKLNNINGGNIVVCHDIPT